MIQRKQTLFLILSVALFVATYYLPFGNYGDNVLHNYSVTSADGSSIPGVNTYYFSIPLSFAALTTLISIFLFGNRQRQMAILRFSFILFAASFALLAVYIMDAAKSFPGVRFNLGISFFLPFASFFLNLFALRAIRKDDQLVRSTDRIR